MDLTLTTAACPPRVTAVLILLPPSEGKFAPARGRRLDVTTLSSPGLTPARLELLDALTAVCAGDPVRAAKALGLGPTQAELVGRNADLVDAPTARADRIYTGVLYDALSPSTLDGSAKRRLSARVAIASALFGIVRPGDRIPAYRLSGDTVLPDVGGVAAHWRRHLPAAMEEAVGGGLLVDLRSSAYAGFWRAEDPARTATVRVLHEQHGTRKVVSHFNKATKGRLVRALLEDGGRPRTPLRLAEAWRDLGWTVELDRPGPDGTRLDVVVQTV